MMHEDKQIIILKANECVHDQWVPDVSVLPSGGFATCQVPLIKEHLENGITSVPGASAVGY